MRFTYNIEPNQYFGEVELIDNCKRLAKVTCVQDSQVLILSQKDFFELFNSEEIANLKVSLQSSILANVESVKEKVLENEKSKRKIRDITVQALKQHSGELKEKDIFRPRSHSLEPIIKDINKNFNNFLSKNTTKTVKSRDLAHNNIFDA